MSTPASNDTRSERILVRHNELKINSLSPQELFIAKTMINYPPQGCAIRRLRCNQGKIKNLSSTIADPILLEKSMDPGQQLFEQLTQSGRKRDSLLVPDLATEWFRKQKVFLDKISPVKLQWKKVSSKAESSSNFKKCEAPTNQCSQRRLARWQQLQKQKLCQQYWQSKFIRCTRVTLNQVQKFEKRYVKSEQRQKAKEQQQQTEQEKNFQRNSISICKQCIKGCGGTSRTLIPLVRLDNMCSTKKKKGIVGPISYLKLPLRCQCACRPTWRKRSFFPYVFQADGQPMSGDCLTALRTEPLLPRLRKKYELRKAPQRQLDPTHFRRISPEFYSLLKQYEDGMAQQYPLYGKSIRHWSETKLCYPCEKRIKNPVDQCLVDEVVKSLSERSKTQLSDLSENSHDKKENTAFDDVGGSSTLLSAFTATMESFPKVEVPCTSKTCTALKHESPILNNCHICNTCQLKPMNQDKKKLLSAKSNCSICVCFCPHQPLETEFSGKVSRSDKVPILTACCSISRCVASSGPALEATSPQSDVTNDKLPHYQSLPTAQRELGSHNFFFQDGTPIEHSSQPKLRNAHTRCIGDFACICKRAMLPSRHLLYNFNNKYRPRGEKHGIKHIDKPLMTKQPHQRGQDIHNAPPSLFKTHPAPCRWKKQSPKISNSNTTLKADDSTLNVHHSCCHKIDFQTLECSCSGTRGYESSGNTNIQNNTGKIRRIELASIGIPKCSHLATNIKILQKNHKFNQSYQDATESYEDFKHPKSHCGASQNLPSKSSVTVNFCEPSHQNTQIETTNRSVSCSNDKRNQRNVKDILKINLLKLDWSFLTEQKHKTEKISVYAKEPCLMRKFPCTHACFLASDFLQLMHRVGRKRANTVSPKRKSVHLEDSSEERTSFKKKQNIILFSKLNSGLSNAKCFNSKAEKISNSQRSISPNQKHCYILSNLETEKINAKRSVRYRKKSTFNKNGSLDSSPDIDMSLLQNSNNVPLKLSEFGESKSRISDSHATNMLQSQNTFDQTFLSFNRNSSFNSGHGKLRSISSRREPWHESDQQNNKLECTSSASQSRNRSSGSENDGIPFPPVLTQNHISVRLLPLPKKNTTWSFKEQTDGTTLKKAGIVNLSETTWIKHAQHANTLQPSGSHNANPDIAKSMTSKMDLHRIKFCNSKIFECLQHNDGSKSKLHKHPNFSQQENVDFKKHIIPTRNDSCGCDLAKTLLIKTPWRWRTSRPNAKILKKHLEPRYGYLAISSPLNRSGSQRCHSKGNHHLNTQIQAPKCKKKSRFVAKSLRHSTSLTRIHTTKSSSIYCPRVPAPSFTCMIHDDLGYNLKPVLKDNQTSVDCLKYTNRCCDPVICYFRKTENSSQEQQDICRGPTPLQPQLHKHFCSAKFLNLNTAGKEEFTRRRMALEKRHKQKYCPNNAQLLMCTRRPPPPQLRTFSTDYRQHHDWGLKTGHICQSQHILQFDDQYKVIQDKDAYKTKKLCNGIFEKKNYYKRLNFTQRSNSGCDMPIQKEDRNQLACCNDKQRYQHCNHHNSSKLSMVPELHIKQKTAPGTSSGKFICKSTSKHLGLDTKVPNWLSCVDDDCVNDDTHMKESGRRNDTRTSKFIFNAETSQNSRLTCFPINTNSSLVSPFDKMTVEWNRKCLEKASSNAPLHKEHINRHFLRPVSVFSDLDFYTHSSERTQPTLQPALRQGESNKQICINNKINKYV